MTALQPTPLRQYGFWRLVLDEAQVVANSASKGASTVADIVRRHAWVVTGDVITRCATFPERRKTYCRDEERVHPSSATIRFRRGLLSVE